MAVYQDITLLPDAEIGMSFLWEKVYQQLHLALVELQDAEGIVPVGIALPGYDRSGRVLGNKLRLVAANEQLLQHCAAEHWLARLSDYVHLTQIRPVPEFIQKHVRFRRMQPKSSIARLARRKSKRENLSVAQALAVLKDRAEQRINAPYVWVKSQSTGERFRLFIDYEELDQPIAGGYTTYGLSNPGSVPLF